MQDRLSLMLDSMIFAVDNGHSFDGIVSVPQMGLEDFGHRPGMAGWLDESTEFVRTAAASVSRFFHRTPTPVEIPPAGNDELNHRDSGIGGGDKPFGGDPVLQISQADEEDLQMWEIENVCPDPDAQLPRKLEPPGDNKEANVRPLEMLPREKDEQASERSPRLLDGPSPQEALPRKKEEVSTGDQRSHEEENTHCVPESIARPNISQSSVMHPADSEDTDRPLSARYPRLKEGTDSGQ